MNKEILLASLKRLSMTSFVYCEMRSKSYVCHLSSPFTYTAPRANSECGQLNPTAQLLRVSANFTTASRYVSEFLSHSGATFSPRSKLGRISDTAAAISEFFFSRRSIERRNGRNHARSVTTADGPILTASKGTKKERAGEPTAG